MFLTGIVFFELVFPLLTSIIELLTTKIDVIKAKDGLKITKLNSKIKQIAENEEYPESKRAIGFQSELEEDYEEVFEEDDANEDD